MEGEGKRKGSPIETLTSIVSSLISSAAVPLQSPSDTSSSHHHHLLLLLPGMPRLFLLLRRFLLLSLQALLRLLILLLSPFLSLLDFNPPPLPSSSAPFQPYSSVADDSSAARALSHLLSVVARVPVASRKYELVRSLADKLLDDNLRSAAAALNRKALSSAFSRTLRRLAAAVPAPADRSLYRIVGAVRSGLRRLAAEEEGLEVSGGRSSEKLAAELLWLAQKMAECGAAEEAVARWGEAAGLARIALAAEPRLQVAFVKVSAFLFKHANAKQVGGKGGGGEEDEEFMASRNRMAMLTSWLPLLCRASNGTDSPTLSSGERVEMVKVLEEMIKNLSWDQQEEVLALWLHHFTYCPDSDWPNLESCYTRWYSESRKLLLK